MMRPRKGYHSMDQRLPKIGTKSLATITRFKYLFLCATVFGASFLIISINNSNHILLLNNESLDPSWHAAPYNLDDSESGYTIKTEGCTIPGLKPYDDNIDLFLKPIKYPKPCTQSNFTLLGSNNTHIWIQEEFSEHVDIPDGVNLTCCYKAFYRPTTITNIESADLDDRVQYSDCIFFSTHIKAEDEFVRVTCGYEDKVIYEQFFLFVFKKHTKSFTNPEGAVEIPENRNQSNYNVIVIGVDAISRLNFYRTMPKTLAYLRKKGAIEFFGYNKVGDNTFPNLVPMLLGIKEADIKKTCWPRITNSFDNCPFIWEWYREAGYYTALGEDSAFLGTFNFQKVGFMGTPTDYYIHTFMSEAEKHNSNNKELNTIPCMGDKYFYQVLLQYIERLFAALSPSKLFGFFWEVTMSHDYLNYPIAMDESYENFLKKLDDSNNLEDTILILLSDHGMRWGNFRLTKQGRLEERLPLMHILLPYSFRKNYTLAYYNIKQNSQRLTTPFDVHATLSDLIDLKYVQNENIKLRSKSYNTGDVGISLFLPIPKNRTCKMAQIDDHWCTCHKGTNISLGSWEARKAAAHLIAYLNNMLHAYPKCAELTLAEVLEATEMVAGKPDQDELGWREFLIVIRTLPGGGIFEATLRHNSIQWTVAGTVSRLNLYGSQSHCMHHYQLKLYCYCH